MQETNAWAQYSNGADFANMYFGTPPYPSSLEIMTFGPYMDGKNGGTGDTQTQQSINYWSAVAQAADAYPNAHIEYMIALNMSVPGEFTLFQSELSALQQYPSIYSFGIEGEYSPNKSLSTMQQIQTMIQATGKPFISYSFGIPLSDLPSGAYLIGHTNWPGGDNGCLTGGNCDQEVALTNHFTNSPYVGISSGYYAQFSFPASQPTCPIPSTSAYTGSGYGWNQCVVDTEISAALSVSSQYRQFVNLCPGFANQQYNQFQLVDYNNQYGQQLRNWIWNAPGYQGNFVLSTSPSTITGSNIASTTTSTTSTISTSSISATTSTQSTTSTSSSSSSSASSDPSLVLSNSNPTVGSWVTVTGSGFPPSSSAEIVVYNNSTNSNAAYLYPSNTSSAGTVQFYMKITSSMTGNDTIFLYSPETSDIPGASAAFSTLGTASTTTSSTTITTISTTTTTTVSSSTSSITITSSTSASASLFSNTTSESSTTSTNTTTSTSAQTTNSLMSSSTTQTHGHGQNNGQNIPQGNGQGNQKKISTTSTSSSTISLAGVTSGISSILSPSTFISVITSANSPVASGFATYELTLIAGLAVIMGGIQKDRKDKSDTAHAWRW